MRFQLFPIITLTLLTICISGVLNEIQIEKREYINPQSPIDISSVKNIVEDKNVTSNVKHENKTTVDNKEDANTTSEQVKKQKKAATKPPKPKKFNNNLYAEEMKPKKGFIQPDHREMYVIDETKPGKEKPDQVNETEKEKAEREWFESMTFKGIGPKGMDLHDDMSCDAFSTNARFNPYSVLYDEWFSFYYWSEPTSPYMHMFLPITSDHKEEIKKILEPQVIDPVDWDAKMVLFVDLRTNATGLLVERNEKGMYWLYPIIIGYPKKFKPEDMRFKQTSDNKYMAIMQCSIGDVFIFSRRRDIPRRKKIPDIIAAIGYRGRRGRSYLYQGHEWMPIPERDEHEYWAPDAYRENFELPEIEEEDHINPEDMRV